jgi:ABC-type polar amino acid transport system ATPase subunit
MTAAAQRLAANEFRNPGESNDRTQQCQQVVRQLQVLTDCSTSVKKGDVVVVCGPSGSGKSTLIKTVNGLEPFQKGTITVDGVSVGDPKTNLSKLRARIGMVFQNFELFPHLSIRENLTIGQIKVLGRSKEEATEKGLKYLDRVGSWRTRTSSPASSPAASSSAWPLPARCRWTRSPCCSTNRPRRWTRK